MQVVRKQSFHSAAAWFLLDVSTQSCDGRVWKEPDLNWRPRRVVVWLTLKSKPNRLPNSANMSVSSCSLREMHIRQSFEYGNNLGPAAWEGFRAASTDLLKLHRAFDLLNKRVGFSSTSLWENLKTYFWLHLNLTKLAPSFSSCIIKYKYNFENWKSGFETYLSYICDKGYEQSLNRPCWRQSEMKKVYISLRSL